MFSTCPVGGSSLEDGFGTTLKRQYRHNHCLTELLAGRKEAGCRYDNEKEGRKLPSSEACDVQHTN